jgi:hypothetical protein
MSGNRQTRPTLTFHRAHRVLPVRLIGLMRGLLIGQFLKKFLLVGNELVQRGAGTPRDLTLLQVGDDPLLHFCWTTLEVRSGDPLRPAVARPYRGRSFRGADHPGRCPGGSVSSNLRASKVPELRSADRRSAPWTAVAELPPWLAVRRPPDETSPARKGGSCAAALQGGLRPQMSKLQGHLRWLSR